MNENTPGQEPESAAPSPAPESTPKSSQESVSESASESATTTKVAEPAGPPYVLLEKLAYFPFLSADTGTHCVVDGL